MELVNLSGCDPAVLFSPAEMRAELQRWNVDVPTTRPGEPAPLYLQRLRLVSGARSTRRPSGAQLGLKFQSNGYTLSFLN